MANITEEMKRLLSEPDEIPLNKIPYGFFNRVQDLMEEKNAEISRLRRALGTARNSLRQGTTAYEAADAALSSKSEES